jgi:hypothetical protein
LSLRVGVVDFKRAITPPPLLVGRDRSITAMGIETAPKKLENEV